MLSRERFEKFVEEAMVKLPENIRTKMDNVAVVVEDEPTSDQLGKGRVEGGSTLLGLYEGVPLNRRAPGYTMVLPDKITIFQHTIERACMGHESKIREQIAKTLWHELGHHFGFDEAEVRKLAQKRQE